MTDIQTKEPASIVAGDTAKWKKSLSDYPAGTWTLHYSLINSSNKYSIVATADGTDHSVTIPAATSAGYAAGVYRVFGYVTNGTERATVYEADIEIKPDLATLTTFDSRTHVKKTLDAIEAVIEKRATSDQQKYTIQGRSLERTPMPDLIALRDKYQALYLSEKKADDLKKGIGGKNNIYVRI